MKRRAIDYFKAAEGWSLPASAMSVVAVACYLVSLSPCVANRSTALVNAFLALVMMMFFQAGSSVLSDCSDHLFGVDGVDDPKVTWIYSGLFTIAALRRYAAVLFGLGALAGLALLVRGNWDAIGLGVVGLALGFGYSFLKYRALGDLAVFLAFALLPAIGVGRVIAGRYLPRTMLVVLPVGLITVAIVHANNWRDIVRDRAAGIKTLPMLVGTRVSAAIYRAEVLLPYAIVVALVLMRILSPSVLAVFITLPLALQNLHPAGLARLDRATAKLQLAFASVYSLSMLF